MSLPSLRLVLRLAHMRKLTQKIVLIVFGMVLLGAGCSQSSLKDTATTETTYENEFLTIAVPDDWTVSEVTEPSAVSITKGGWILYINASASQASGVTGGRFVEISMGAPSVDAVITEQPSECGTTQSHDVFGKFTRVDYLMNATDERDWCEAPTNGKFVWFFSYLTSPGNGFFNYGPSGQQPSLVITMAYDTDIVNDLPEAKDEELEIALQQMTEIASTLSLKKNPELLN